MYFTMHGKDGERYQEQLVDQYGKPQFKEAKKFAQPEPEMGTYAKGVSYFTLAVDGQVNVGDNIILRKEGNEVVGVEPIQLKGEHPQGVQGFKVKCNYTRFIG